MSDIFVSYKREEQATARQLADALEKEGWSVWWDPKLRAGEHFDDVIEKALNEAKCVIVMWSERSVQSRYVRDEATYALDRDKLIPVAIENVSLPFRFRGVHTLSLLGWDGSKDFSEFRRLVDDISTILGPSPTAVAVAEEQRRLEAEQRRKVDEERFREQERQQFEEEAKRKADEENRKRIEEERNRAAQETELRRLEAEAQRKAQEERLAERQRSKEEARQKSEEEERRHREEQKNREREEQEPRRLVAEARRRVEERLREQERQRAEEEARRKADEETRRRIDQKVPSHWRTYGPVVAAVTVVLILFSFVFWWPKPQVAPIKKAEGHKEPIKEAPMVKPQPPPKEIVGSAPEKKPEAQKEIIRQPPVVKIEPETRIETTPQKKAEAQKDVASKATVTDRKQEKPIVTHPALMPSTAFRDPLESGRLGPGMKVVHSGSFQMGDLQGGGLKSELPVRTVRIQKPFAIGLDEVTFEQYDQFAAASGRQLPSDQGWGRGRRPVINVSWEDAVEYAKWLSAQTGKRYRLPTEAEWEYAARAGTETAYWWGKDFQKGMANCEGCGSQWDKRTAPTGSFKPNPLGLSDTASNVREWVADCWHNNYTGAPANGAAWLEENDGKCKNRVLRSAGVGFKPWHLRSSFRDANLLTNRYPLNGFRLARDIDNGL